MKKIRIHEWAPFAWQGFTLRIPSEWNPGRITGDYQTGGIRLDDPEVIRMEMEWREARDDPPISNVVDRYIEGLTREMGRRKLGLEIQRAVRLPGMPGMPGGEDREILSWESDCRVHALACRCGRSNRILFLRIVGRLDEDLRHVAGAIFPTVEEQDPEKAGIWALYDLYCTTPRGFRLETCSLRSGHIRLQFARGATSLMVDRLSMAGILLKEIPLRAWYEDFYRKELRDLVCESRSDEVHGHAGIRSTGTPKSRWRGILSPLPFLEVRRRLCLEGRAWHCVDSNKIYALHAFRPANADPIPAEEICRGVVCHKEDTQDQPGGHARLPSPAE